MISSFAWPVNGTRRRAECRRTRRINDRPRTHYAAISAKTTTSDKLIRKFEVASAERKNVVAKTRAYVSPVRASDWGMARKTVPTIAQ